MIPRLLPRMLTAFSSTVVFIYGESGSIQFDEVSSETSV